MKAALTHSNKSQSQNFSSGAILCHFQILVSNMSISSTSESFRLPSSFITPPTQDNNFSDEEVMSQRYQEPSEMELDSASGSQRNAESIEDANTTLSRTKRLLKRAAVKKTCREYCCAKNCLRGLGFNKIKQEREIFFGMKRSNQNNFLRASIGMAHEHTRYTVLDEIVCRRCFLKVFCVSNQRMKFFLARSRFGEEVMQCSYTMRETPELSFVNNWLDVFVGYNGENLQNCKFTHLPDNFTKAEVYNLYVETLKERNMPMLSLCSFLRVWRKYFSHVKIPKKTRMGVCQICAELKAKRDTAKTSEQKGKLDLNFEVQMFFWIILFNN